LAQTLLSSQTSMNVPCELTLIVLE